MPTVGSEAVNPPGGSHEDGFLAGYSYYFSQMYVAPAAAAVSTVGQAGTAVVNNVVTEAKLLPGTLQALPGAYIATASSGQQASGLSGGVAGLTDSLNPFGGGIDFGPLYGHTAEYQNGVAVGQAGGFVMNAVMTVSGARGVVTGIQALRSSTGGLVQLAQLRLVSGGTVNVIFANGEAVVATEAALAQVGVNGTMGAMAVANLAQTVKMSPESSGGWGSAPSNPLQEAMNRGMKVLRGSTAPDEMVEVLKKLGRPMSREQIGEVIHTVKDKMNIGAAEDLIFDRSGGMWDSRTGEYIGKMWEPI